MSLRSLITNRVSKKAALILFSIFLFIPSAAPAGPVMTDNDLFMELNLAWPSLGRVKSALDHGDKAAALHALADYYRRRQEPDYFIAPGEKASPKPGNPDTGRADVAMLHEFVSVNYPHTFGPTIDWNYNPTAEPNSPRALADEWTWALNRHAEWTALSRAYSDTGDERYAQEFVAQMTQWARDCPMPGDSGNRPLSAWRTIDTGIRAAQVWPELWYRFLLSPAMTDEALITFLKAYIDHAHHLMAFHSKGGNWLAMEGSGLFYVGVLFPEFRNANQWRHTGLRWIYTNMKNEVYPDGVQIELSSTYQQIVRNNYLLVYNLAKLNEVTLPSDFLTHIEKMYDFDIYAAMPDRKVPGLNDGDYRDVHKALSEAAQLFADRQDILWYTTDGKQGLPPAETSYDFPDAGYSIMRSGWDPDARFMLFDAGPFGYSHQHEDKLQMVVEAYGKLFLLDPGNYINEKSAWRDYFTDSQSHNVVLVDGEPQRRRDRPKETWLASGPTQHIWFSEPTYDYAEATYDEGYDGGANVSHTRSILFIKPDFWVVLDTLAPKDGKQHRYDALFHFDSPLKVDGTRFFTENANEANMTIAVRPDFGVGLKIVRGQQDPLQGWLPDRHFDSVYPAPVGIASVESPATAHFLYVIVPYPKGMKDPVRSVAALGEDGLGARITFAGGVSYDVHFQPGKPAWWSLNKP